MRIIAGKLKGLKLNEFDAENIRPTIDRVREAIFSKIQFRINGAKVLDLFCGTGAVSLEFLSRGANVVMVDNNPNSEGVIRANFKKAKLTPNLITCDYLVALEKLKTEQFDIVFLDPPFASDFGQKAVDYIAKNNMLSDNGIIVFEHIVGKELVLPECLKMIDKKKYGTVEVSYLEKYNG